MRDWRDLHRLHLPLSSAPGGVRQGGTQTVEKSGATAIYLIASEIPERKSLCSATADYQEQIEAEGASMVAKAVEALRRMGKGTRGVEDSVSYAVGHRIRIEILAALHEGPESAAGLAKVVRQRLSTVTHHIEELLADGSIEVARTKQVRVNMTQHFYRVVELPEFSDEEIAAMSLGERQALAGLILQASMAESLASLWAGKMKNDPRVFLAWNRINLDRQGRDDFADEQIRSWQRVKEIECESTNRRAVSGEPGVTYIVTSFGYERSRTSAPPPVASEED
jgi:DNA-binding transcriptional ArsR family regulator